MQTEREACFRCAEPVALDAQVCPHCGTSALVLVALPGPVADGRACYQVARGLSSRAVALGPVNAVTATLAGPSPRLGPVTRSAGYRVLEALDAVGLAGEFEPEPRSDGSRRLLWIAAAAVAVVAAAGFLLSRRSPAPAPAAAVARPVAAPAAAAPVAATAPRPTALSPREVAARVIPATVLIRCAGSLGSGFVVGPETVLTAAHVVCGGNAPMTVSTSKGAELSGFAIERDAALDIASVRVPGLAAPALPLADAAELAPGDRVMAVGNPMGLEFTVSEGIVSSTSQLMLGVSYIQTDVKINPGNSGGPLVDDQGRAVGVVSMKVMGGEGLGFAVPVNYAWDHSPRLVEAPANLTPGKWQEIVARANLQNQELRAEASAELARPVLVGAYRDPSGRQLLLRVGRASPVMPRMEEVTLRVTTTPDQSSACMVKADVTGWKAAAAGRLSDSRLQAWLDSNQLAQSVWVGEATVRIDQCPHANFVELVGANPAYARAQI